METAQATLSDHRTAQQKTRDSWIRDKRLYSSWRMRQPESRAPVGPPAPQVPRAMGSSPDGRCMCPSRGIWV